MTDKQAKSNIAQVTNAWEVFRAFIHTQMPTSGGNLHSFIKTATTKRNYK